MLRAIALAGLDVGRKGRASQAWGFELSQEGDHSGATTSIMLPVEVEIALFQALARAITVKADEALLPCATAPLE